MSKASNTTENTLTQERAESAPPSIVESEKTPNLEIECAEKENDDKLWTLALRYAHGIGVEKNAEKALEYLNQMSKEERYQEILRAGLYAAEDRIEIARDLYYIHYNLYNDCYALSEFLKTFTVRGEKIPPEYLEEAVEYCENSNSRQLIRTADFLIGEGYAEGYYIKAVVLYNNDYEFEQKKAAYVLNLLETANEKGCSRSLRLLCSIVSKSQMSTADKLRMFKYAAESGEADGAYYYAELFEKENLRLPSGENSTDRPIKPEPPQNLSFIAAEQGGSVRALYRLALNLRKDGMTRQPEKYFQALKAVAQSERRQFAFFPAARYLLAEAYQYGIGTQKDLDEADVWYESIYTAEQPFMRWLKEENDKERKRILFNLVNHEKRYRLYSRPRPVSLPQWLKRFDEKLWKKYVADDSRFWRGQTYIEESEKYPDNKMPREKVKALKHALRLGNGKACDVIEKYYSVNGIAENRKRIKNLKTGVKLCNPCCMFYLGRYLSNTGDFKLQAEGARLTRSAANRRIDLSAIKNLSLFYEHGTGVEKDLKKSLELMIECFDAENIRYFVNSEKLIKEFCSSIGYSYYSGKRAEKDLRKAALWFRRGADYGCPHCMKNLGWMHFNNEHARESDALSRRWLQKAVVNGYEPEDNTYHGLGYFHQYGVEGKQDFFKAIKYYRMHYSLFISKENSPENVKQAASAAFNLGVLYSQQLCDFENAIVWYKKALALMEKLSTLNNLASCYTNIDSPDFEAAEALYNRILETAPKHSYAIGYAYSNLANIALNGSLKKADFEKARELKKRAAEELETTVKLYENGSDVNFNNSVYYNLANMYLNSVLIERNPEKAKLYAVKGAKRGHYEAVNLCKNNGFKY